MPDKTTQATLASCSPSAGTRESPNARPRCRQSWRIAAASFGHEVSFSALPRPVSPQNILPNRPVSAFSAYLLLADGQGNNTTLPRRPCFGATHQVKSLPRRRLRSRMVRCAARRSQKRPCSHVIWWCACTIPTGCSSPMKGPKNGSTTSLCLRRHSGWCGELSGATDRTLGERIP